MTTSPRLITVLSDYLLAVGWTKTDAGWLPPGHRMTRATKRRAARPTSGASYSTIAAVQTQLEVEFGEDMRRRREEQGLEYAS